MSHAKKIDRPFVSVVDKHRLFEWSKTTSCNILDSTGHQMKPYRCKSKRDAVAQLAEITKLLSTDSLILTFPDQVTVEVFAVHGIFDFGKGKKYPYNNSNRYFIICEIEKD